MTDLDLLIDQMQVKKEKPGKVFCTCPVCKHKFRKGDKIISNNSVIITRKGNPAPTMPKVTCLQCGVDFYPPEILEQIKNNIKKGENKIITLQ